MKKLLFVLFTALIICTSCTKEDSPTIEGKWQLSIASDGTTIPSPNYYRYEFNPDGSGKEIIFINGQLTSSTFTYKINGNVLSLFKLINEGPYAGQIVEEKQTIHKITKTELWLIYGDNNPAKYTRI